MNRYDLNLIKADLNLYFNRADASIGFSSSHASFVATLEGATSHGTNSDNYSNHIINNLDEISLIHKIYKIFSKIPHAQQRILEATYSYEYQQLFKKELPQVYHIFKSKTGSALIATDNKKLLTTLCMHTILKDLNPQQQQQIFMIRDKSSKLFDNAHYQYLIERKKVFCK